MKTAWTVMTAVVAVGAVCLIFAAAPTRAQGPAAPPRYGVVDLSEVVRQFKDVQAMKDKLQKRLEDFQKEGEARRLKIEEVRFNRDQLHPDSPKWFELQKQLNRLTVELEIWGKLEKADIQAEQREQQDLVYKKVLAAVEAVGKHRRLDMVFRYDTIDLNDPNQMITPQQMGLRTVVYSSPTVDLTKEVIARANSQSGKK